MKLMLEQASRWLAATPEPASGSLSRVATGYSIDSRTLAPGDLFFAIRGERFDGHDFVAAAFEKGACAAVVAKPTVFGRKQAGQGWGTQQFGEGTLLVVEDTLVALQRLASSVRRHWGRRLIGITGSAGKTTTKDAIAAVLSARFRVLKSQGNLNNGYGLPLQLLRLEPEHDVAVIEMGMSHAGEIAALCHIAAPDWGVVTNVGNAHAENFADGVAGVARSKYELVAGLPRTGTAFLNCDDHYVGQFGRDFEGKTVYFGRGPCAEPRAVKTESLGMEGMRAEIRATAPASKLAGDPDARDEKCELRLRLLGEHNVTNALAAVAVGLEAGIPLQACCAALATLEPGDKRGQVLEIRGAAVINDCYNSNPAALKAMIAVLRKMPAQRRILVAGEMLELGPETAALHAACGKAAEGLDVVVGVRGHARDIVEAAREAGVEALFVETPEEAGEWLREHLRAGDAALLKASRGVRLETALEGLTSDEGGPLKTG
ncbi:MAG TPA: UDP-N-acetylmuramoyl-tripeptide--D-alanyl-D-alanine ligase [Acidobacteriaceae bacterium]|nr:UDP-N-acetylmuramoyl-tripeptide--D-alanyl-D-alanine ligase [Acidobacteriaceae bacterium]